MKEQFHPTGIDLGIPLGTEQINQQLQRQDNGQMILKKVGTQQILQEEAVCWGIEQVCCEI